MLIIANVTIFLVLWLSDFLLLKNVPSLEDAVVNFGMIPRSVMRGERLYTVFTSMFLHGDFIHLGGNMLFLYVFGDNIEDAFGHGRYLAFYVLSGIVASVVYLLSVIYSGDWRAFYSPTIGASGAIAGVLGAYLVMYPRAKILTLVLIGWMYIVPIPAIFFLGVWFVYQMLYGMLALGLEVVTGIAYWAHIGGFLAGIFFGLVWRGRRRIRTI